MFNQNELLTDLTPLLTIGFETKSRNIKSRTIDFWNISFGKENNLDYGSLHSSLSKIKNKVSISLPNWDGCEKPNTNSLNLTPNMSISTFDNDPMTIPEPSFAFPIEVVKQNPTKKEKSTNKENQDTNVLKQPFTKNEKIEPKIQKLTPIDYTAWINTIQKQLFESKEWNILSDTQLLELQAYFFSWNGQINQRLLQQRNL